MMKYENLSREELVKMSLSRAEGKLASNGALTAETGERTGRSTKDRFIVKDDLTADVINWGAVNQPISTEAFEALYAKASKASADKDMFVSTLQVGADLEQALTVKVTTEYAWHNLFVNNLFIQTDRAFDPATGWTMLSVPSLTTDPAEDGVHGDATLIINIQARKVLLCGLRYAGEMKKAMFTVMNFIMPTRDVLPMHCGANMGENGDVALFFGLSGTGKTTLSSDPDRYLIGDDEHGWSKTGVFNFEGGCYAKCIDLSEEKEPLIYKAIKENAIMENVVLDDADKNPDYADDSLTQNTRAAYPLTHIVKRVKDNKAGSPNAVLFLTCDLYGVLPPIAKLTSEQAAYYFLSGYTALVGSTEVGQGPGVKPTFSACFGAPFFPRHPQVYADLLMKRVKETGAEVFLVNTGWTGGAYGKGGERFSIPVTRSIVTAILSGELKDAEFTTLPGFKLAIPTAVSGVASDLLDPRKNWGSAEGYTENSNTLIDGFKANFKKFSVSENISKAGPEPLD
jgi:phosphoenolpyruvate carboxykinase (ATP)